MIKLRRHTTLMHPLLIMMIIQREEKKTFSVETKHFLDTFSFVGIGASLLGKGQSCQLCLIIFYPNT